MHDKFQKLINRYLDFVAEEIIKHGLLGYFTVDNVDISVEDVDANYYSFHECLSIVTRIKTQNKETLTLRFRVNPKMEDVDSTIIESLNNTKNKETLINRIVEKTSSKNEFLANQFGIYLVNVKEFKPLIWYLRANKLHHIIINSEIRKIRVISDVETIDYDLFSSDKNDFLFLVNTINVIFNKIVSKIVPKSNTSSGTLTNSIEV